MQGSGHAHRHPGRYGSCWHRTRRSARLCGLRGGVGLAVPLPGHGGSGRHPGEMAGPGWSSTLTQRRRHRGRPGRHRHAMGPVGDDGARARTRPQRQGRDQHGQRAGAGGPSSSPRPAPPGGCDAGGRAALPGRGRSTTCRRPSSATWTSPSSPMCSSARTNRTRSRSSRRSQRHPGLLLLRMRQLSNASPSKPSRPCCPAQRRYHPGGAEVDGHQGLEAVDPP